MVPEGIETESFRNLVAYAQKNRDKLFLIRQYDEHELWKTKVLFNELVAEIEFFKEKNGIDVFHLSSRMAPC